MRLKTPESSGFHGIMKTALMSACNTHQGLTRSTGLIREGLPVMVLLSEVQRRDERGEADMSKGTPIRNVRVPDDIWKPAKDKAEKRGDNLSEIIRKALIEYNKQTE